MFGDLSSEEKIREETKKEMQLGILPAAIIYNAIMDRSILEDISWSDAIVNSELLMRRIPLATSYTLSGNESGLPPVQNPSMIDSPSHNEPPFDDIDNAGGRPESEGVTSEGQESDMDNGIGFEING